MHVKTFETVNMVTAAYVEKLRELRQALLNQVAQIDSQILVCEDFADDAVDLPLPPPVEAVDGHVDLTAVGIDPAADKPEGGYVKPLFQQNWEAEQAAGQPKEPATRPAGVRPRITLTADDEKRLEQAITGS